MKTRRYLPATIVVMIVVAAMLGGCSDDNGGAKGAPSAAQTTTVSAATKVATAESTGTTVTEQPTKAPAEPVEVQGVVGSVNAQTRIIEIRPTSGGSYSMIQVEATTKIRRAGGGTGQFSQIRSSDRILAVGVAGDERDVLIASEITIQQVVPGSQPGG